MDIEKPVMSGYLLFPPQGIVFNLTKKKIWVQKYCLLFKASNQGIERLEIFDALEDITNCKPRIITLENCVKISQNPPTNFAVVTKTIIYHMAVLTEELLLPWVTAFQSVAFKEDVVKSVYIEEDNELYCTSGEDLFTVKLVPSEASQRCGFEPKLYMLYLTANAVQLCEIKSGSLVATWPYMYIRRYGYRGGKFTFEAGRKCLTGEGTFHLEHSNQQEIFRSLSAKMKSMKKLMSGESVASLDCSENHFQAAMSMEARSRSPFPPSPTNYSSETDISKSSKFKNLTESLDSSCNSPNISSLHIISSKPQPQKPIRKHIFTVAKEKLDNKEILPGGSSKMCKEQSYEPIAPIALVNDSNSKYDFIELRHEAWKTLGLDEVRHTENARMSRNELPTPLKKRSKSHDSLSSRSAISTCKPSNILTQLYDNKDSDSNYDRLQYFGSNSKLNRSFGYKSINVNFSTNKKSQSSLECINDNNDLAENIQPARLADDTHQGYGMIRKPAKPGPQVPPGQKPVIPHKPIFMAADINHTQCNGLQYALVSKTKQV